MRKEELIKQVAESTGIAICEVRTVIEAALKETVDAVANGKTLYIRGFGTLSPKHYKRKVARNIHKNETIVIAEHYTPHFKPAKSFKNRTKNLQNSMENEKMQVNFAPGVTEATLRVIELHEENQLPVLEPDKVELAGTIGSVHEFLLKRISEKEQINQKRCYILVDREKMTLKLVTNETDSRNKATVRGELKYYPKFLEFGINTSKTWEPVQLSKFFKMNRAFFKDAQYNMELVTVLKNFKASIDSKVENSRQDNGSRTDNYSQVVNSNLPASFNLIVPIFKGRPAEEIEVEIIADVDGRNIRLSLCSPGAEVIVEEERNKAIDEQLLLIRKLAPDIAIIEQ